MTDSNRTLVGLVVDRSGSMAACRQEMQDGINSFLQKMKAAPGKVKASLAQFDTEYELLYPPTNIKDVPSYTLTPRGCTALLDAMGKFITSTGEDLAKMPEAKRPDKVLIVVVTDGYENSSTEWTEEGAVRKLVEQQQKVYNWEFVFLGANMDAVHEAGNFGIQRGSAMTYNTRNAGVVFDSLSSNAVAYASASPGTAYNWSDEDREKAVK